MTAASLLSDMDLAMSCFFPIAPETASISDPSALKLTVLLYRRLCVLQSLPLLLERVTKPLCFLQSLSTATYHACDSSILGWMGGFSFPISHRLSTKYLCLCGNFSSKLENDVLSGRLIIEQSFVDPTVGGIECSVGMFDKRTAELKTDCQHHFLYVLGCCIPKNIDI